MLVVLKSFLDQFDKYRQKKICEIINFLIGNGYGSETCIVRTRVLVLFSFNELP